MVAKGPNFGPLPSGTYVQWFQNTVVVHKAMGCPGGSQFDRCGRGRDLLRKHALSPFKQAAGSLRRFGTAPSTTTLIEIHCPATKQTVFASDQCNFAVHSNAEP
jgi:hypothetical protein